MAQLCALRLLQQLPSSEARNISVITFASPAVGNQALARAVQQAGWQDNFRSFLMPGWSTLLIVDDCHRPLPKEPMRTSAVLLYMQRTLCRA